MLTRRLALRRETLAALTPEDMAAVGAAGADASSPTCFSCLDCVTPVFHPSVFAPTNCCQGIPTFHRDAC